MQLPQDLVKLIALLRKLPSVGKRTAERFAFDLIKWPSKDLSQLSEQLSTIQSALSPCEECGCLTQKGFCLFCTNTERNTKQLCILSSAKDAYSIEQTHSYHGLYHVVEHLLSPLDGRHQQTLRIDRIEQRIKKHQIQEMIIAFDSTLEGDTTALYLKKHFQQYPLTVSRLAFGLPLGSHLEYVDEGTLARSLMGRQTF